MLLSYQVEAQIGGKLAQWPLGSGSCHFEGEPSQASERSSRAITRIA